MTIALAALVLAIGTIYRLSNGRTVIVRKTKR
jgi:hypothetical protein